MPILRNKELRRSWKEKRPSTEKESEKQTKLPSVQGNHVQPSREPSKRKGAKQLDPNFAYFERISKNKKGVVKQPVQQPSQSDKGLSEHSSKKTENRVDRQPVQHASQYDEGSADRSSGTPAALKAVQKLIDECKKNNLPPNRILEKFKAKVMKNVANYSNEECQPASPRDKELVDNPRTDGDESSDADDEDVHRRVDEEDVEGRYEEDEEGRSEEEDHDDESEDDEHEEDHESRELMKEGDEVSDEGDESGDEESDEGEAQQVKKKRGRGEAKIGANLPFEDRPKLYVIGERAFRSKPFDSKVVSTIAQLVKRHVKGPYATYGEFPNDTKKEIMRAFLMKYRWGNSKERERCCEVFHRIARCRYSNILTKVREDVAKKAKSSDPMSWKLFPPSWLRLKYWKELCDYWSSPAWQKKSSTMRENRIKSGVHVHHRQDSSNCYTLSRKMGQKLDRNVTYAEVYVKTRMQKNKEEFLTKRADMTWDNYCRMMAEKYGEDPDEWPSVLDAEIWFHASGGKKMVVSMVCLQFWIQPSYPVHAQNILSWITFYRMAQIR